MLIITMIKIWLKGIVKLLYITVAAEFSNMQSTESRVVTLIDVNSCLSVVRCNSVLIYYLYCRECLSLLM
jgi:hypothetical protein